MVLIEQLPIIAAQSGRFVLRAFRCSDRDALVKHLNSSHVARRISNIPHPYERQHAEEWLARLEEERTEFRYARRIDFGIDIASEIVGSVALINIDGHKAQLSYWLGGAFHGNGMMTEALKLVVEFGQETCGFVRIWGYTWENNPASRRVLEKAGFVQEGIHCKEWFRDGVYHDSVVYAIVR